MATQAHSAEEIDDYNVRLIGPQKIKKALKREQNRRWEETGKEVPVMEIAKQWLAERADDILGRV